VNAHQRRKFERAWDRFKAAPMTLVRFARIGHVWMPVKRGAGKVSVHG